MSGRFLLEVLVVVFHSVTGLNVSPCVRLLSAVASSQGGVKS